jgi:hypothetical protein
MNNHENLTSSTWGLVSSLAELHAWELDNLPLLSTLTGRHLYFRMAEETFQPEVALTKALKDLFGGAHFTEKALRSRLREMERDGLIQTITRQSDARSKQLIPTPKFHQLLETHAEQVKRTFDKHFLLVEK